LPAAERGVLFSTGWVFLIPRILGVAESLQQRWEAAEAHFRAAIDVATDVGARPELGRAYLDYACMLAARGRRRDRHRALDLVKLADPVLQSLGMEPFLRRTTRLAETLHGRLPMTSVVHAAAADVLTKREVEVLLHMAQGRTKQEIGDELMLGVQTIDRHLRTLFKKIGVNSQEAAASYARQHRLDHQHPAPARDETPATHADMRHTPEATTSISPQLQAPPLRIILVTDMEGSTSLIQRWGDAQAYTLLRFHNTIIRQCLSEYQGSEITHTGDGVMASFASATSAITCAIAIQRGFAQHNLEHANSPIRVRIGINAGEPIPTEGQLFGAAVHTAFRICSRAKPSQILAADAVHQLAAGKDFSFVNRGRLVLRGFPGRFRLYEVQWTIAHV
jgi:class 3 adenylate cyclase